MPRANLTKRTVDALEFQPGCNYFVWDTKLKGFGLHVTERVDQQGVVRRRKTFVLQYRPPESRVAKRITIGAFGPLTPEEAREEARLKLSETVKGIDPIAARRADRNGKTVSEVGTTFLDEVDRRRKPGTAREYRRLWTKHIVPEFGSKQVSGVSTLDIKKLHRSLHSTPYVANRVIARLATFFTFAISEGATKSKENPTKGVEFYPETGRERFLSKDEFSRLGAALAKAESVGLPPAPEHRKKPKLLVNQKHRPKAADVPIPANPFAIAAIRLLALTGCRESEILSLRWSEVDFERGYIRLNDSKTGKSVRPLNQSAAAILQALPTIEGNAFVLPGLKPNSSLKEIKRLWYAVRHVAELKGVRLHDLRHSFASVPASSGESLLVVKALLGHKNIATTERYAHLGDDPVRRAADQTANQISEWLGKR